ncbi:hypothetical protein FLL45_18435 [Aliikangiella marina]|uniref:Uncharacterized protein n=1 Tax=Aliikangiella marina TaxID=1712262 RepID=A0A545T4U2_9GAMM|nr:hypothetical protein [Aliikangiella marina]TQV72198.1 hypothetical protein FLL45_18435 [Aliikangiella marina]
MSFLWVTIGAFFQLGLAFMLFMLAAFAGGGVANGKNLSELQLKILGIFIYLLPLLSVIAAAIIIYQYRQGGSSAAYWWHGLPILGAIIYLVWIRRL